MVFHEFPKAMYSQTHDDKFIVVDDAEEQAKFTSEGYSTSPEGSGVLDKIEPLAVETDGEVPRVKRAYVKRAIKDVE